MQPLDGGMLKNAARRNGLPIAAFAAAASMFNGRRPAVGQFVLGRGREKNDNTAECRAQSWCLRAGTGQRLIGTELKLTR